MDPTAEFTLLTDHDIYLWNEGSHFRLYEKMGSHLAPDGEGTYFAVWAPNAEGVSVIGDWNGWDPDADPLRPVGSSGVWAAFVPAARAAHAYKYRIRNGSYQVDKADPFAFHHETPPRTASKIWDLSYEWEDDEWMRTRGERNRLTDPISVYEVHLGSWRRDPSDPERFLTYRELAPQLAEYVSSLGFTHVEFLPVMEHPFYGSWGYQTTGYFAPTSRYGTPQDFMYLIDTLHQAGIGVILDWVPSHFPTDEHGLGYFDGTHLFEHADPRQGFHPDWKSFIFNYGRAEVPAFLISSALFWLDRYHVDGLRVDAVASMLYLDYSRKEGEWIPNRFGGRESLEAIEFLRRLNETAYGEYPEIQTIAEESTAWPMVSRPLYLGGLGFGMKWDMGWMHDTLEYFSRDPLYRLYHHNELTFRMVYAFTENFMLPLSHDEVVHGKGSMIRKMPGDQWQQFANLRLLYAYMWTQPGKKLLFMGNEFAQWSEWNHDTDLDWHLLDADAHSGIQRLVADLNRLYREEPALHELDTDPAGFEWVDANDNVHSVLTYLRKSSDGDTLLVALNFTPEPRHAYRVGVPHSGRWDEVLNTDARIYGGSGQGNLGGVETGPLPVPHHGRPDSIDIVIPPLGAVVFKHRRGETA
ncbi:MAG: 1,4-alpha-glucan branching protein GlgB [Actinomycetes bacterium]|jgi:1,4-alpha-glucan branching enzyme|nr:1,4-alpha-glucan branching protein GlgB [Acidimicrobiia bacterium]